MLKVLFPRSYSRPLGVFRVFFNVLTSCDASDLRVLVAKSVVPRPYDRLMCSLPSQLGRHQ